MSSTAAFNSKGGKGKKYVTRSTKAGLTFPVGRIARFLKAGRYAERVGAGAPVYLAGVLEYLAAEVLELAGEKAKKRNQKRITPSHIKEAVGTDSEFDQLLGDVTIRNAAALPLIHHKLLPKSTGKKAK